MTALRHESHFPNQLKGGQKMGETRGIIFNIQHFSIEDGPGIRTVVFFKGCPLRCSWCANPESQNPQPEAAWTRSECTGCLHCVEKLKELNVTDDRKEGISWDESVPLGKGNLAGLVGTTCPSHALHIFGETKTVAEILEEVEKDKPFYETSGGGLTISGGEPLMQPRLAYELLDEAHAHGISTCIETSAYASRDVFLAITSRLDYLIMDVKCLDPEIHRQYTGVTNEPILANLKTVRDIFPDLPVKVRTPVIPGVNDCEEEIAEIARLAHTLGCEYELLKYHRLGESKYLSLHRYYPMGQIELTDEKFQKLKKVAEGISAGAACVAS